MGKQFVATDEIVNAVEVKAELLIVELNLFDNLWEIGTIDTLLIDIRA